MIFLPMTEGQSWVKSRMEYLILSTSVRALIEYLALSQPSLVKIFWIHDHQMPTSRDNRESFNLDFPKKRLPIGKLPHNQPFLTKSELEFFQLYQLVGIWWSWIQKILTNEGCDKARYSMRARTEVDKMRYSILNFTQLWPYFIDKKIMATKFYFNFSETSKHPLSSQLKFRCAHTLKKSRNFQF